MLQQCLFKPAKALLQTGSAQIQPPGSTGLPTPGFACPELGQLLPRSTEVRHAVT